MNLSIAYGTTIENAIGGSARDVLWGNEVANRLEGRGGDDVLNGFEGADTLVGGRGNDLFKFTVVEKGDIIADFARGDRIDLSGIDANTNAANDQAFAWIGNKAFSGVAGQLRYSGGLLEGDINGDGIADFGVTLIGAPAIGPTDIIF
jgi:serralysin